MKSIVDFRKNLQSLVYGEYSYVELTKKVGEIFGRKKLIIEWDCYSDGNLTTYDAMANIGGLALDIYWLPCKANNQHNKDVFIVAINVEEI